MADYAYYTDTYLGSLLTQKEFDALAQRAGAILDRYCRQYTVTGGEDAKAMALCAMAEVLHRNEGHRGVARASIGGVQVHYREDAEKTLQRQLYQSAATYLDIYRGRGA